MVHTFKKKCRFQIRFNLCFIVKLSFLNGGDFFRDIFLERHPSAHRGDMALMWLLKQSQAVNCDVCRLMKHFQSVNVHVLKKRLWVILIVWSLSNWKAEQCENSLRYVCYYKADFFSGLKLHLIKNLWLEKPAAVTPLCSNKNRLKLAL